MAAHPGSPPRDGAARSPETVDRLMVGVCGAIWLVLLAVASIATVALVQLGRGGAPSGGGELVVAAVQHHRGLGAVIIGAIPLLLRARRTAAGAALGRCRRRSRCRRWRPGRPPIPPSRLRPRSCGFSAPQWIPTARSRRRAARGPPSAGALDRLWLRGTASLLGGDRAGPDRDGDRDVSACGAQRDRCHGGARRWPRSSRSACRRSSIGSSGGSARPSAKTGLGAPAVGGGVRRRSRAGAPMKRGPSRMAGALLFTEAASGAGRCRFRCRCRRHRAPRPGTPSERSGPAARRSVPPR